MVIRYMRRCGRDAGVFKTETPLQEALRNSLDSRVYDRYAIDDEAATQGMPTILVGQAFSE